MTNPDPPPPDSADAPPGTVMVKRTSGEFVVDQRKDADGSGRVASAVEKVAEGWKRNREMTAFALVCGLLWVTWNDNIKKADEKMGRIEAAIIQLSVTLSAKYDAQNARTEAQTDKLLFAVDRFMTTTDKASADLLQDRKDRAEDRKLILRAVTNIERTMPKAKGTGPPPPESTPEEEED